MTNSSLLLKVPVSRKPAKRSTAPVATPAKRDSLTLDRLKALLESYLMRGDIERHSPATLTNHRYRVGRLVWLAEKRGWATVGYPELQKFFLYLNHAHEEPGGVGRWDNPRETEGLKPGSVKSFHLSIRAFFRWCVAEDELDTCPVDKIGSPIDRPDQIQPLTEAQADALNYRYRESGGAWRDVTNILPIVWTPCTKGGARPWFLCERCRNRAAVLYRNPADVWACRKCHGLSYQCQRENPADRGLRKAFKAQDKIEPGLSLGDYPDRPKGMHRRTYDRLSERADNTQRDSWRAAVKQFGLM